MKFEKLSDKKFEVFKPSEVVSPILISGGYTDTLGSQTHDRFESSSGTTYDNLQETVIGQNFTQDAATTSDHTDII